RLRTAAARGGPGLGRRPGAGRRGRRLRCGPLAHRPGRPHPGPARGAPDHLPRARDERHHTDERYLVTETPIAPLPAAEVARLGEQVLTEVSSVVVGMTEPLRTAL